MTGGPRKWGKRVTYKTRADMMHFFNSILNRNYHDIVTNRKYSYGHNAVKSYVIECHIFDESTERDIVLQSLITRAKTVDQTSQLQETEEESLLFLQTESADYFVDIADRRFIVLHSAEPTRNTDPFIQKFYNAEGYDRLWLPVPLLLDMEHSGKLWGFGVSFCNALDSPFGVTDAFQTFSGVAERHPSREYGESAGDDEDDVEKDFSLSVQRHFAARIKKFMFDSQFRNMMGISRMSILKHGELKDEADTDSIIDDIKYDGKVTAKGNSFARHMQVLCDLVDHYRFSIKTLEKFRMEVDDTGFAGSPITIHFSNPIAPRKLVDVLFTGDNPFRLWGISDEIAPNAYRVYAVDMHHGNKGRKLTFEIFPEYLRVILPTDSCANTVLRLMANINHYVDAMAHLKVSDYEIRATLS
jgi:hypothetical protein